MSKAKSITVLFVDDDEVNRYAGARLLRLAGYDVLEATTGEEALAALDQKPDIAVIDVHLPDIDGFTLCQRVKSSPESISLPVLLMSATFTSTADRVQGLEEGADGYLAQPFELPVLRATITAMLRVREAEEKANLLAVQWQTTFDAISDGIWILDNRGEVVRGNAAMGRLWHSNAEALEGRSAWDIIRDSGVIEEKESDAVTESSLDEFLNPKHKDVQQKVMSVGEREFNLRDRWFRVISHRVTNETDENGVVQVWSDITQRKLAEQERLQLLEREKEARLQAEEANRLKDEFLATLSHELRTPLMAIIGWSELLKEPNAAPDEFASGLEIIERNARNQSQIVNDLLDVSRVIAGKMQLEMEPLNLASMLQNAISSVRPAIETKGITVIYIASENCQIMGDMDRLQQILWNLLSNAVKFTPRDGRVEVSYRSYNESAVIEIRDSGQGIEPQFLPYVFDRFRQADSSSTRHYGGLGLGLSIVRHLTEMHGGQVAVNSEGLGLGTTFTLTFPLLTTQKVDSRIKPTISQNPNQPLTGVQILIVDDQEETLLILSTLLRRQGAQVESCESASEAIEKLQQLQPDLLISDLGMPGEDGYSLIERVRLLSSASLSIIPALALSAYADSFHREKALKHGFDAVAAKPIDINDLVKILSKLMEDRKLDNEVSDST